ncbi:MAG: hypothetical protein DYG85_04805 [Chloroflexi bacterium CFX1]|nr:hypothetical protein [Chloroflexi bacterium CFX1]
MVNDAAVSFESALTLSVDSIIPKPSSVKTFTSCGSPRLAMTVSSSLSIAEKRAAESTSASAMNGRKSSNAASACARKVTAS